MNHPGRSPAFVNFMNVFPIFAVLLLMGCAGEPVQLEFPINHPANPEALETHFTPPQNPFQADAKIAEEPQPDTDAMMKHKMPESNGRQHGGHNMDSNKESGSVPQTPMKPDHREDEHLRKEGNGR